MVCSIGTIRLCSAGVDGAGAAFGAPPWTRGTGRRALPRRHHADHASGGRGRGRHRLSRPARLAARALQRARARTACEHPGAPAAARAELPEQAQGTIGRPRDRGSAPREQPPGSHSAGDGRRPSMHALGIRPRRAPCPACVGHRSVHRGRVGPHRSAAGAQLAKYLLARETELSGDLVDPDLCHGRCHFLLRPPRARA
jgi:hypothetical protein